MRLTTFGLAALALGSEVYGKRTNYQGAVIPAQREDGLEALRREVSKVLEPDMVRRQATTTTNAAATSSSPGDNGSQNFNTPQWNADTIKACTGAISSVRQAQNPAGMIACYNLPFFNNKTGVFEADLRLYQLTTMTGAFTGVAANQISLALSYPDASVTPTNNKREILEIRQGTTPSQIPGGNTNELQQFAFVGQVNKKLTLSKIKTTSQMALLIPTIELSAPSPADNTKTVNTNLTSVDTVYFVNGVFKGQSAAGVAAASPTAERAAATSAALYVVPGTTFGIFPTGFIVTMVWMVLFVSTVGYGTYGRHQFRMHYRERVKRQR